MKKIMLIFSIITFVVLSSSICYASTIPEFVIENGNTVLGTFKTSTINATQKQLMRDWMTSNRNLLFRSNNGSYYFITFPIGSKYYINRSANGLATINFLGSNQGLVFANRTSNGVYDTALDFVGGPNTPLYSGLIITSNILTAENISLPTPVDYIASWQGDLIIRDDDGLFDSENESDGLLGWLKNFWDSLLNFVKSIFVPEDGYFEKWYNDIRTAANEKFKGILGVYDTLKGGFEDLQSSTSNGITLKISFPENHFFSGSPVISADFTKHLSSLISFVKIVLTSIVVVYTGINCYKYLIVLFEQ